MKYLKGSVLYTSFLTAFGWYMQIVRVDPRIRLVMFFLQAAVHEYCAKRHLAQPESVDQVVDFLQTAMKPRKKGRDDALLDLLKLYLESTRVNSSALEVLKESGVITNMDFWNLVLVESVMAQGRHTLTVLESQRLIDSFDTMKTNKISNAINKEREQYRIACHFPKTELVNKGVETLHLAALLLATEVPLAKHLDSIIKELEDQLVVKSDESSDTVAAVAPST